MKNCADQGGPLTWPCFSSDSQTIFNSKNVFYVLIFLLNKESFSLSLELMLFELSWKGGFDIITAIPFTDNCHLLCHDLKSLKFLSSSIMVESSRRSFDVQLIIPCYRQLAKSLPVFG